MQDEIGYTDDDHHHHYQYRDNDNEDAVIVPST